jgi:periplasmic protein TonB
MYPMISSVTGRRPASLFNRTFATSLLLHAGALLAAVTLADQNVPPPPPPAIEISLGVAPTPVPAAKTPEPTPPKPQQHPQNRLQPHLPVIASKAPLADAPVVASEPAPPREEQPAPPAAGPVASASAPTGKVNPQAAGNDALPYVIDGPAPPYPPDARAAGREGKVRVKVLISETGRVQDIVLAQSSGNQSLDDAALAALKRWRFRAAVRDGQTIAAWVVVPVLFKLH